ncbi:MAG TPA: class II aldolase/adducin family protein [Candidatus Limnocylindria bacterium]|nr:class II aldolase/adducin family protein [Candidatus Limnocylindria bacterium]
MRFDLLHPADQLVMIMQRIYEYGMTTTSGGNLSIRDENGDVWMTPSGIDKGSLTRSDMIQIKPDGTQVGMHRPSVELPLHMRIYAIRPDLRAVLHAHPPTLIAFSLVRRVPDVRLVPDVLSICGEVGVAEYAVPGSEMLGENIARRFSEGYNTVLMENHGCVIGAKDLFSAFMAFETLDFSGRLEIDALKLGVPQPLSPEQLAQARAPRTPAMAGFVPGVASSQERAARRDMCRFIHRSYDQRLFTSTQGTYSQRLTPGRFLITPYNRDRKYLEPEDLVLIRDGMCQAGTQPSRSVFLHQAIYDAHPDVGSILIAHAPSIMAFAVTHTPFDSRLIPESYISLRDVRMMPFLSTSTDIPGVAAAFSPRTPVVIVQNECVVVTGRDLLHAFDRLEVLEFSAKAVIAAKEIGAPVLIDDRQVSDINAAFHLD